VVCRAAEEVVGRPHDQPAAREPLADVVVRLSHEVERHAAGRECAEALARRPVELDVDGVRRQAGMAVAARHLAGEHGADRTVHVGDRRDEGDLLAALERRARLLDQADVERTLQAVVLRLGLVPARLVLDARDVEHPREVEAPRLPVLDAAAHVEQVGTPDHLVEAAETQLRHELADLLGDEEEVVDDVFRLALELAAQDRVLGGHAHRAGVQVALAHHDATLDHQRRSREAELVGAQQGPDDDIAARLHLAVDLHHDAAAQAAQRTRSAPSRAVMTTSRPVFIWPWTCTTMRLRRPFSTSVCWVSDKPSSQGVPACLMDDSGEAPVPPSWPAMTTWSAFALATPAATVPTPTSDTSLTDTEARGLAFLRSWISWARSSIE